MVKFKKLKMVYDTMMLVYSFYSISTIGLETLHFYTMALNLYCLTQPGKSPDTALPYFYS